jgi:two-component system nitrogen regulation response regulator NtrX
VALGARPVVVGAHASCDLVLVDPQVSRRHAEVAVVPEGIRIKDLGSTNGTWWQGTKVGEVVVPSGATVQFGATPVRISAAEAMSLPPSDHDHFGAMAGKSVAMRELFAVLEMASPSEATVLIEGESGTGKELAARAIHEASGRAKGPFVVVDCSAITENLFDSHLFGHVRGAFTGAVADRRGKFEVADGGTIFLDEIGDMSLKTQAKVLRVLQEQTMEAVGGTARIKVDARVLAATNKDLQAEIRSGRFREDLYFRLNVIPIFVPALRDRQEDIPLLADHFMADFAREYGRRLKNFESGARGVLQQYPWPGNVRELRNVIERLMIMVPGDAISSSDLSFLEPAGFSRPAVPDVPGERRTLHEARDQFERDLILRTLAAQQGNMSRTAEVLGVERSNLYRKMKAFGIAPSRRLEGEEEAV